MSEESERSIGGRWESVTEDGDSFLQFEKVSPRRSQRPDLHAFMLLDELFPGADDMISAAEHDEIWLSIGDEQVEKLTDDQIIELSRCGVRFNEEHECLCMFA